MIRSKGEAGTGDVSNAVTHARPRRDPAGPSRWPGRSCSSPPGPPGPYDPGPRGRQAGATASGDVHRRVASRRRRCAAMMMQGCRASSSGHGIFKSGSPAQQAEGDREGDDVLRRPTWSPRSRAGWVRRWSASTSRILQPHTASPSAGGDHRPYDRRPGGPGRRPRTPAGPVGPGVAGDHGPPYGWSWTRDGPGGPRRRVDDDGQACGPSILLDPLRQQVNRRARPSRDLCRYDHARRPGRGRRRRQETIGGLDITVRQRCPGGRSVDFEDDLDFAGLGPGARGLIRRRGSSPSATGRGRPMSDTEQPR